MKVHVILESGSQEITLDNVASTREDGYDLVVLDENGQCLSRLRLKDIRSYWPEPHEKSCE